MPDLTQYPARVPRHTAMKLLCVPNPATFKKVVDATPGLAHKLPGEKKAKYLTSVIATLLAPATDSRCATEGEEKTVERGEVRVESKKAPAKTRRSKSRTS